MSQDLNPLPEELAGVERTLSALRPAPAALDRDGLMYEAGRAAARRSALSHLRLWQGTCALLLFGCVAVALLPREKIVEKQIAVQPKPQLAQVSPAPTLAVTPTPSATPPSFPSFFFPALSGIRRPIDRAEWPTGLRSAENTTTGNASYTPTLRRSEGLDAFPSWQQRLLIFGGNRS